MKKIIHSLLSVLLCYCLLALVTAAFAADKVAVENIQYRSEADKETILFTLGAHVPFHMFTLKGDKPRLVIDFKGGIYSGPKTQQLVGKKYAHSIRTGFHRNPELKTRVVVDLVRGKDIFYSHKVTGKGEALKITLFTRDAPVEKSAAPVSVRKQQVKQPKAETDAAALQVSRKNGEMGVAERAGSVAGSEPVKEIPQKENMQPPTPLIEKIRFDNSSTDGEKVRFYLNGFYPPAVAALEEGQPRVLCDFRDVALGEKVDADLETGGKYIKRVRAAIHKYPAKIRVILDLEQGRDYDLQQVFFKHDNLFVITVKELAKEE